MAIYKISDILNSIQSMKEDGFEYVGISELTSDEEDEKPGNTLVIEAIEDSFSTEADMIDSSTLPENYRCHS